MPQASSMSDARGMLQAAARRIELLIIFLSFLKQKCDKKLKTFGLHETRTF
jgi:hypothetical protein